MTNRTETVHYAAHLSTPVGPFLVVTDAEGRLVRTAFAPPEDAPRYIETVTWDAAACAVALDQLAAYFAGERTTFELPVAPVGTDFEQTVWAALCTIPFGQTTNYGALAARLGRPGAARAVGRANALNPIPVVIPCHRVIGANGALTGFAGGLDRKAFLLAHEGVHVAGTAPTLFG